MAVCVLAQVRDRATLYLHQLQGEAGGPSAVVADWNIPFKNLEKALQGYLEGPCEAAFDLVIPATGLPLGPTALQAWGMQVCSRFTLC
jgi:hypothetical protein